MRLKKRVSFKTQLSEFESSHVITGNDHVVVKNRHVIVVHFITFVKLVFWLFASIQKIIFDF